MTSSSQVAENVFRSIIHQVHAHDAWPATIQILDAQRTPMDARTFPDEPTAKKREHDFVRWLLRFHSAAYLRIRPSNTDGLREWLKSLQAYAVADSTVMRSSTGWRINKRTV